MGQQLLHPVLLTLQCRYLLRVKNHQARMEGQPQVYFQRRPGVYSAGKGLEKVTLKPSLALLLVVGAAKTGYYTKAGIDIHGAPLFHHGVSRGCLVI